MKDNISITVSIEYEALLQAAKMFNAMAGELQIEYLKHSPPIPDKTGSGVKETVTVELVVNNAKSASKLFPEAGAVFGKNVVPLHQGNAPPPAPVKQTIAAGEQATPITAPLTGVELDSDGLPWDVRIHGKNKLKLAKTQQWKKRRGIDPALVETVEAELRAAMNAGKTQVAEVIPPAPPVDSTVIPPNTRNAGSSPPAPPVAEVIPPTPPAPPTGLTFPELMAKITTAMGAGTMTEAEVIEACNNQGVASLALVAVRPDLIPAIVAELFPS